MAGAAVARAPASPERCGGGMVRLAVSRAWAERAHRLTAWLDSVAGLRLEYVRGAQHPEFAGADALRVFLATPKGSGVRVDARPNPFGVHIDGRGEAPRSADFFDALAAAVAKRDRVRVLWEARATPLVQDARRPVRGVLVLHDGATKELRARRGIVLSSGSFQFDDGMELNYLNTYPVHLQRTTPSP